MLQKYSFMQASSKQKHSTTAALNFYCICGSLLFENSSNSDGSTLVS